MELLGVYGGWKSEGGRIPQYRTCCSSFCSLRAASSSPRALREVQAYGDGKQGTSVSQEPLPSFPPAQPKILNTCEVTEEAEPEPAAPGFFFFFFPRAAPAA